MYIDLNSEYGIDANGGDYTQQIGDAVSRIQAAGRGTLVLRGEYGLGRTGSHGRGMFMHNLREGVNIISHGATIRSLVPYDESDTRAYAMIYLLRCQHVNIIGPLTLDGNGRQGLDEQWHAIELLDDCDWIRIQGVTTRWWRGDGLKITGQSYSDEAACDLVSLRDFSSHDNLRSCVTIQRRVRMCVIDGLYSRNCDGNAIDCEPTGGSTGSVKISNAVIRHENKSAGLTLSNTYDMDLDTIEVDGGSIDGINVRRATLYRVKANALDNPSSRPGAKLYRGTEQITLQRCEIKSRLRAISLDWNNGVFPRDITIDDCKLLGGTGIAGEPDRLRVFNTEIVAHVPGRGRGIALLSPPDNDPYDGLPATTIGDWVFRDVTIRGGFEFGLWMRAHEGDIRDVTLDNVNVYDTPVKTARGGTVIGAPIYVRHWGYQVRNFVAVRCNEPVIHVPAINLPPELQAE